MRRYSRITGTGSYLPPRRLANADMVAMLAQRGIETSDDWIVERTGIRARYHVDDGVNASDLALQACLKALEAALGSPARPVVAVVGGAKVSTKLDLLGKLVARFLG